MIDQKLLMPSAILALPGTRNIIIFEFLILVYIVVDLLHRLFPCPFAALFLSSQLPYGAKRNYGISHRYQRRRSRFVIKF